MHLNNPRLDKGIGLLYNALHNEGGVMKLHIATFTKANGEVRTMKFILVEDLPQDFLKDKVKNTGKKPALKEGQKLVWDTEADGFRILNTQTLIGEIKSLDMDFDSWYNGKVII
jgi:hypothetical protein